MDGGDPQPDEDPDLLLVGHEVQPVGEQERQESSDEKGICSRWAVYGFFMLGLS
jgi:hypothetical protein